MKVGGRDYRTVFRHNGIDDNNAKGEGGFNTISMIDQNLLPFEFRIYSSKSSGETCMAIRDMTVRGAGAIGAAAGYAMAQAVNEAPPDESFWPYIDRARKEIEGTRPTARNLFYAVERVYETAKASRMPRPAAYEAAKAIADEDALKCRQTGEHGGEFIRDGMNILTHCNAGWLAFVDWGTALSPIYDAHRNGKRVHVWVDETRPRGQGARLTAWELENEGVPHTIIPDNAAAYLMSEGRIDLVIVGADRIAMNGDVANKIGTLDRAILAKEYAIPFWVAAPTTTIDALCKSGREIPIELRSEDEVLYQTGPTGRGKLERILVASPGSHALNPAFDVTPSGLITWIFTEKGPVVPQSSELKLVL
jgi:methylthioribose-1-phosphate isomerase